MRHTRGAAVAPIGLRKSDNDMHYRSRRRTLETKFDDAKEDSSSAPILTTPKMTTSYALRSKNRHAPSLTPPVSKQPRVQKLKTNVTPREGAKEKKRRVLFKHVEVREMYIHIAESSVPGDGGPPVGLSPTMKRTLTHELDCFEHERETGQRHKKSVGSPLPQRRGKDQFVTEGRLSAEKRRAMLARAKASEHSVAAAEETAKSIQKNRSDTNRESDPYAPFLFYHEKQGQEQEQEQEHEHEQEPQTLGDGCKVGWWQDYYEETIQDLQPQQQFGMVDLFY
mmetsp:Transcript_4800/g.9006  ORF Transcript_4800/g.9006 Transcript_4800/m.9006 type:complete len:281 (-) Transcript_4800:41-883(-)